MKYVYLLWACPKYITTWNGTEHEKIENICHEGSWLRVITSSKKKAEKWMKELGTDDVISWINEEVVE